MHYTNQAIKIAKLSYFLHVLMGAKAGQNSVGMAKTGQIGVLMGKVLGN